MLAAEVLMRQVKSYRPWKLLAAICIATIALGSSNVFALPRTRPVDPGDGPGDPGDVPEEPVPRPRPDRPPPKPQVPGYVLFNGAYYRETTLPLCEWGSGERSYHQFIGFDQDRERLPWTCRCQGCGNSDDTCSFAGAPDSRPTNAEYWIAPIRRYLGGSLNLSWSNGSAAYGAFAMWCTRAPSSTTVIDSVNSSSFEGIWWNGGCDLNPRPPLGSTVVAEVVGGDVEHVRPALVRAQANIRYNNGLNASRNIPGDLVLAIQVFRSSGWEDFKTVARTTGWQPSLHEIEATVPEGSLVRLQVRGTQDCRAQWGDGYDIRSLRIQVETCIPDQTNPGECL